MEIDRNRKHVLVYYAGCLLLYSCILWLGAAGNLHAFNITENTLFASKLLCLVQLLLGFVQCHLFANEEKNKGWKKKVSKLLSQLGLLVLCTITVHLVAVLYGAPAFESVSETFHFASLLVVFSVYSSIVMNNDSWSHWFGTISSFSSADDIVTKNTTATCFLTVIGAWLGAFPIALDWDRPWQVWPRSCMIGTLFGHCCGLLLSFISAASKAGDSRRSHQKSKYKRV